MTMTRYALLMSALVAFPSGLAMASTPADEAEYLGGTVKSIPANTAGALDLQDAKELKFQYGKIVYRLPYSQVESYQLEGQPARRAFGKIPLPRLSLHKKHEILNLSFRDAKGEAGTLSFQLNGKELEAAESLMAGHVSPGKPGDAALASIPKERPQDGSSDVLWADHVWKTQRNQNTNWPAVNASTNQQTTATAGTK
jgi:hypothetical protein